MNATFENFLFASLSRELCLSKDELVTGAQPPAAMSSGRRHSARRRRKQLVEESGDKGLAASLLLLNNVVSKRREKRDLQFEGLRRSRRTRNERDRDKGRGRGLRQGIDRGGRKSEIGSGPSSWGFKDDNDNSLSTVFDLHEDSSAEQVVKFATARRRRKRPTLPAIGPTKAGSVFAGECRRISIVQCLSCSMSNRKTHPTRCRRQTPSPPR